jgi:hypothetical protein
MHPTLTPLAEDVDFRALAEQYEATGGDIRNAVLKAAMAAAGEPGGDAFKVIHQRHLEEGIKEVMAAKRVMKQSLFTPEQAAQVQEVLQDVPVFQAMRWMPVVLSALALLLAVIALIVAAMK